MMNPMVVLLWRSPLGAWWGWRWSCSTPSLLSEPTSTTRTYPPPWATATTTGRNGWDTWTIWL